MAGVFIAQTASGIRVAVTGAGASGVFRWTEAEAALSKDLSAAALANLTVAADDLNEDIHGSREYRAQLVKVMAGRAAAAISGKK
jgi:carbon-monoxide dehydrogenase medium subunit